MDGKAFKIFFSGNYVITDYGDSIPELEGHKREGFRSPRPRREDWRLYVE
jgi:hypothetical protein